MFDNCDIIVYPVHLIVPPRFHFPLETLTKPVLPGLSDCPITSSIHVFPPTFRERAVALYLESSV